MNVANPPWMVAVGTCRRGRAGAAAARWRAEPRRASTPFANTDPCAATAALGVRPSAVQLWECGFEYREQKFLLMLREEGEQQLGPVRYEIDGHPVHRSRRTSPSASHSPGAAPFSARRWRSGWTAPRRTGDELRSPAPPWRW
ncbi:hypothetical protein [Nocardia harenae]|uniref:hypothetical protein n=1 Tax=Nocardia harenae TaxID=358707 RepID=UPI0008351D63|nr:hypothetical protein [Nocardia harenae]